VLKPSVDNTAASFNMRCGDCLYFNQGPKLYASICSELGVQDFAPAPSCFVPNTLSLIESCGHEVISVLNTLVTTLEPHTIRLLSYQLSAAAEVAKSGFTWGQKVYFSLGGDYLSHYFSGVVIGQHEHGRFVVVSSRLRRSKNNIQCTLFSESCMTAEAWAKHAQQLVFQNRIDVETIDKRWPKYKRQLAELLTWSGKVESDYNLILENIGRELYEPPSIDVAPEEVRENQRKQAVDSQKTLPKKPGGKNKFLTNEDGTQTYIMSNLRATDGVDESEYADQTETSDVE
jgi:hypothetical protein